jgi:hypothetical protein
MLVRMLIEKQTQIKPSGLYDKYFVARIQNNAITK